jgi:hypothetical protein
MIGYTLSIATKGSLLTDPDVARRFDREITATLAELGALGQARVVHHAPHGVSSGGGGLRGSIFTEARGTPVARGQLIATSVYYAPVIEVGRRAGATRPPIGPILRWVQLKMGKSGREAQGLAFYISERIGRLGFKTIPTGAKMFQRTATELRPLVQSRFQALANRIGEILK